MNALLAVLFLAIPVKPASTGGSTGPRTEEMARFVFAWRGVPVGTVTLTRAPGRFTYESRHLHTRDGQPGERVREVTLAVDAAGHLSRPGSGSGTGAGSDAGSGSGSDVGPAVVPQALWLWHGPPASGCVTGREELSGREGPHCVTAARGSEVEGTLLGTAFRARYGGDGRMEVLEVGDSRFTAAPPGVRLRAPPELFSRGLPVEGGAAGALALEPSVVVPARLPGMTAWDAGEARALAARVHAAFPDKGPSSADWRVGGAAREDEAGGCLAHALRFAALARKQGQRVGLVHGLLVVDGGPARPHAWVRVALAGGGTLDLDPTSLDPVSPDTHLPVALVEADGVALAAGERWLALLRGEHRVVRRATRRE